MRLSNVTFVNNSVSASGGGVCVLGGRPEFLSTRFVGNKAARKGGGMHVGAGGSFEVHDPIIYY